MTDPIEDLLTALQHDSASREVELDDPFTRAVRALPAKHWAKYDLSAVALGWNMALDAARSAHRGTLH